MGVKRHDAAAFKKEEWKWASLSRRKDYFLEKPTRNHRYVNDKGVAVFDDRYDYTSHLGKPQKPHPKIVAAIKNRTITQQLHVWYHGIPPKIKIPIAGSSSYGLGCLPIDSSAVSSSHTTTFWRSLPYITDLIHS